MTNHPQSSFSAIAESAKLKAITEMALDFTAMTRKFAKGSNIRIRAELQKTWAKLDKVRDQAAYDKIHSDFCDWFIGNVQIAKRIVGKNEKRRVIAAHSASFGHAAKVLDIAVKVYVYYCSLPSPQKATLLLPFLHAGLDNQLISDLIDRYPDVGITSNSLEDVDRTKYEQLQEMVHSRIRDDFQSEILPVQYDDIMFRKLNRPAESEFNIVMGGPIRLIVTPV